MLKWISNRTWKSKASSEIIELWSAYKTVHEKVKPQSKPKGVWSAFKTIHEKVKPRVNSKGVWSEYQNCTWKSVASSEII